MSGPNQDQQTFWSETVGDIWAQQAGAVDATFAPILRAVLAAADLQSGMRVLDVGCGAGTSTFEAATLVGVTGLACGLDISKPLLQAAKQDARAQDNTRFILADAQTAHLQEPPFDAMISRFGVMFFADPTAAFRNIAAALRPGAGLSFATWGAIAENPFFTLPAAVSKAHFGPMPKSDPDAPGPFSMRDADATCALLKAAGLSDALIQTHAMALTPKGDARDVAEMMCQIGPAKGALSEYKANAATRAAFVDRLAKALAPYVTPDGLRIPSQIHIFTARKPLAA